MKHALRRVQPTLLFLFIICPIAQNVLAQRPVAAADEKGSQHSLTSVESGESASLRVFALRLRPGQDLRQQIEAFVKQKHIRAGFIITTVGSLRQAAIRLADQPTATSFDGKFEIVSLVGTLGQDGVHLHLSISDNTGKTIGGHLVAGCLIYTTAEIVIGEAEGLTFSREKDSETTYQELRIRRRTRARGPRRPSHQ